MRDALLFLVIFGSLPFILKRPAWGAMVFAWLSLMNPHRLSYGAAYSFPFALLVAGTTVLAVLISRQPKSLPKNTFVFMMLIFAAWMTLTSVFALEPSLAWTEWERVMKTYGMVLLTMMVVRTEDDIKKLMWVIGMSLGFYGLKGGIFTIASGGSSHVFGPEDSYITDNNALALALITVLPILCYLQINATKRYLRWGYAVMVVTSLVAALGSYSRGGMLAGAAMLVFLWLKSRTKVRTGLALALVAPLVYMVMPEKWFGRMETIDDYQTDASALGRINAWRFAWNVAESHLLGGGYRVFTPRMFYSYAPVPTDHHAAHSIYFQVLGEHGVIGLFLFVVMLWFAWRTGSRVIRLCKGKPEFKWAGDLGAMGQVSLIGYTTGGAFLTLAYYDLIYYITAAMVVVERLVLEQQAAPAKLTPAPPSLIEKDMT